MILKWILLVVFGCLLGSVMFCNLIARKFGKKDLRKVSQDGNPGAANVFWYCGKKLGILALSLDVLKGLLPVILARIVMMTEADVAGGGTGFFDAGFWRAGAEASGSCWFAAVMLAPVLGHAFPIFEKFKGGKCISTSLGVMAGLLGLSPAFLVLGGLDVFFSFVAKIKIGNVRALVFFSLFTFVMAVICAQTRQYAIFGGCALISVVAIYKHLPLMAGSKVSDNKVSGNKKKGKK